MTEPARDPERPYGLLAEFREPETLRAAAERAYAAGYRRMDAYTPFPVHGLAEALGFHRDRVAWLTFLGGLIGGGGGYFLQYYGATWGYRIDVGGRPYHSWPAFIPIAFETTILGAALATVVGMFVLNHLPQPYHPVFNSPRFQLATRDKFFLCIQADDPRFDAKSTREFLVSLADNQVEEVAS
jgi:hypothetical protein